MERISERFAYLATPMLTGATPDGYSILSVASHASPGCSADATKMPNSFNENRLQHINELKSLNQREKRDCQSNASIRIVLPTRSVWSQGNSNVSSIHPIATGVVIILGVWPQLAGVAAPTGRAGQTIRLAAG